MKIFFRFRNVIDFGELILGTLTVDLHSDAKTTYSEILPKLSFVLCGYMLVEEKKF